MSKLLCIPPISSTLIQRIQALNVFSALGFLNVVLVHKTDDILYETFEPFLNGLKILTNPEDSSLVFPDKVKNLNGMHFKVPYFYQPPVVDIKDGVLYSPMLYFLEAVGIAQNARVDLIFLPNSTHLIVNWLTRSMHLTINSGVGIKISEPKLLTYEKKSYCALVPVPLKASFFHVIFIEPFDSFTWIFIALSVLSSVAVWRMFQSRGAVDSHWKVAFGIFTIFIRQGADFSLRNRTVLVLLLNIICLTTFLLSNLYEGALPSLMIKPSYSHRLQTVDDLLNSNYEINANPLFKYTLRNSSLVQAMAPRLNTLSLVIGEDDGKLVIDQHYVFIRTCDVAEITLKHKLPNGRAVSDYYYLLSEELSWQFIQLEASYFNPFLERLQYFMNLSFQAGLPQMWKVMASQDYSQYEGKQKIDERSFLELQDLVSIFGLLIIGSGLSAIVLFAEIFYHDCLHNLNTNRRNVWKSIKHMSKYKRQIENPKVRSILVRQRQQDQ
ncbi:unnamed protein product [Chironomus riparius]|uniref:Ionotropic receptor n=1 Tax=Chironomus riparius TaxID=315576 RepID=A0A9N9S0W0_9DIPT|nr:unnamed protein product [Chironomus riparius]